MSDPTRTVSMPFDLAESIKAFLAKEREARKNAGKTKQALEVNVMLHGISSALAPSGDHVELARPDEAEDYAKSVAKEALAYRNALLRVKERMKTWPIDDYENCMCGSTINSHNIGSGHSPVAVADHAVSLIVKDIEEVINDPMGV